LDVNPAFTAAIEAALPEESHLIKRSAIRSVDMDSEPAPRLIKKKSPRITDRDLEDFKELFDTILERPPLPEDAISMRRIVGELKTSFPDDEALVAFLRSMNSKVLLQQRFDLAAALLTDNKEMIAKTLGSLPPTPAIKSAIQSLMKDPEFRLSLAQHTFSQPHAAQMRELIEIYIRDASNAEILALAKNLFSTPHGAAMPDLILLAARRGSSDSQVIAQLIQDLIHLKPYTPGRKEVLRAIASGNFDLLVGTARKFGRVENEAMKDIFRWMIEVMPSSSHVDTVEVLLLSSPWRGERYGFLEKAVRIAHPGARAEFLAAHLAGPESAAAHASEREKLTAVRLSRPPRFKSSGHGDLLVEGVIMTTAESEGTLLYSGADADGNGFVTTEYDDWTPFHDVLPEGAKKEDRRYLVRQESSGTLFMMTVPGQSTPSGLSYRGNETLYELSPYPTGPSSSATGAGTCVQRMIKGAQIEE
jgi:hypothetical protein